MFVTSNLYSLSSFKGLSIPSQLIILGNDGIGVDVFNFNLRSIVSWPRVEAAPIAETVIWGSSLYGCRLTKLIADALVRNPRWC